jgi:hypothetical protein
MTSNPNPFTTMRPNLNTASSIDFALDLECMYNVINTHTLLSLTTKFTTQVTIRPHNDFVRPMNLSSSSTNLNCNFPPLSQDLCLLFFNDPIKSDTIHSMEFFVIHDAVNTISGCTLLGSRLARIHFKCIDDPLQESSATSAPSKRYRTEVHKAPSLISSYPNHLYPELPQSPYPPLSSLEILLYSATNFHRVALPLEPCPLIKSAPLQTNDVNLDICVYCSGLIECMKVPFRFDNGSPFPVISLSLAITHHATIHSYSDFFTLHAGFTKTPFHARNFCLLNILLPGDNAVRLTPFLIAENPHLQHILFPIQTSPVHILQTYLRSYLSTNGKPNRPLDPKSLSVYPYDFSVRLPASYSNSINNPSCAYEQP